MSDLISKISLGTAQFGLDYGIANKTGKIDKKEVFNILKYAFDQGINVLDTACAYGESEMLIGEFALKHKVSFDIISKVEFSDSIEKKLQSSLDDLGQDSIYAYLVHSYKDFIKDPYLWDELVALRSKGKIKNIGFSLYSPNELTDLFDRNVDFDIIQIPYSVFDRRFEEYFTLLKEKNIQICIRSVFLQGLAFVGQSELEGPLRAVRGQLDNLNSISSKADIPVEAICLNFAFGNEFVDKVIIGVDSLGQLVSNIDNIAYSGRVRGLISDLDSIKISDENILMPYKWELV